jgi:AraC family transcriptional regulator
MRNDLTRTRTEATRVVKTIAASGPADVIRYPIVPVRSFPDWLDRAREMLDASLANGIRLDSIAAEVGVHRVHLSRTFARFFGCTVSEYIRRRRVQQACALLLHTPCTGSAIAAAVGFADESHMGRAFKEIVGRSPRQVRS